MQDTHAHVTPAGLIPPQESWSFVADEGFHMHVDKAADDTLAFASSVAATLEQTPRWLECKYLYDAKGSALFEAITEQPEYYQTRTEDAILHAHAKAIRQRTGGCTLAELGSGSSSKTQHLLDAWTATESGAYVPMDVSAAALKQACLRLRSRYPSLALEAITATYPRGLPLIRHLSPVTLAFLGSSIGNFNEAELDLFLEMIAANLNEGDFFLLGIDLVKDATVLEASYNDAAGVTAAFTQNLFARMNQELGTEIAPQRVRHVAFYNDAKQRIEIYAEFRDEVNIVLPELGRHFRIAPGERILTEVSRKFEVDEMAASCARFGLTLRELYQDEAKAMAVLLFERQGSARVLDDQRAELGAELQRVRSRTYEIVAPLSEEALVSQPHALLSPIVWDLGHIANFEEQWLVRGFERSIEHIFERHSYGPRHPEGDDAVYDPTRTPRKQRSDLPLPSPQEVMQRLDDLRTKVRAQILAQPLQPLHPLTRDGFVVHMVAQHEAQHQETILQSLQLGTQEAYLPGFHQKPPTRPDNVLRDRMVRVPAGSFLLGTQDRSYAYDNERPQHRVELDSFFIDTAPVTNADYLAFINQGGYQTRAYWSDAGWQWLQEEQAQAPLHWVKRQGQWLVCDFGRLTYLDPERPVVHVSWYEADAYARSQGKRLPTEAEWEKAACWDGARHCKRRFPWGDESPSAAHANLDQSLLGPAAVGSYPHGRSFYGCHQMIGDVWEWTASDFQPYPGFEAFPYADYSEVFFGDQYKVLRGGSWATLAILARGTLRNWDFPQRRQIFAGFRCASDHA